MTSILGSTARKGAPVIAAAALAGLCLLGGGCGENKQTSNSGTASTTGAPSGSTGAELNGAGATFPQLIYQKWFQEYKDKTGVAINYQGIGSGGGIKQITAHSVDFGASDAPMSDAEMQKAPGIQHIPTVAGAVVIAYNLPGVPAGLKFTGPVIANIYLGKIKNWNDPAIAGLNPGAKLPATPIVPVHRADGSGTTNIFTTYLSQVSPDWKNAVGAGKDVKWPGGTGGKGNPGVAALVKQTPGAVGYVELAYADANKIPYGQVQNSSGAWISPTIASTTAAATGVTLPADFREVITNTSAKDGYPITGFTFILVYKEGTKPEVKKFLQWALTDGEKDAATNGYAPLPENVDKQALAAVDALK
jgi:phosphate transport system substrate-binding protein